MCGICILVIYSSLFFRSTLPEVHDNPARHAAIVTTGLALAGLGNADSSLLHGESRGGCLPFPAQRELCQSPRNTKSADACAADGSHPDP